MPVNWTQAWGTKPNKSKGTGQDRKEYMREYMPKYRAAHKDEINARHREIYNPSWEKLAPGRTPLNAAKDKPPPCGGDHRNCPYDGACRYPNWGDEQDKKREAKRRANRAYRERRKERMATDPEYAAKERARAREATARLRARKKAYIEAKKGRSKQYGTGNDQGPGAPGDGAGQAALRPGGA